MKDDHRVLVKELVAAPYGQAEVILRQRGLWNEKRRANDGTARAYRVKVTGTMEVSAVVKVQARNSEEAEDLAVDAAHSTAFVWRDYGDVDCIDAEVEE
jgi:hypothetical protein